MNQCACNSLWCMSTRLCRSKIMQRMVRSSGPRPLICSYNDVISHFCGDGTFLMESLKMDWLPSNLKTNAVSKRMNLLNACLCCRPGCAMFIHYDAFVYVCVYVCKFAPSISQMLQKAGCSVKVCLFSKTFWLQCDFDLCWWNCGFFQTQCLIVTL